jgi:hypothetical protein
MRQKIIAFLLSALVFPGLGQLYNRDRRKGLILVLSTNALLGLAFITALILVSREYTAVFFPRPLTREMVQMLLTDNLTHPLFLIVSGLLLALWGYAAVDAALQVRPPSQKES